MPACHPAFNRRAGARLLALGLTSAILAGCASTAPSGPVARAELTPTAGNGVSGWVQFEQVGAQVRVSAELRGLKPNAEHGFHVHDKGDCASADGMSAGGHFNPGGKPHAHHGQVERHAGDMPNLQADAGGVASVSWNSALLSVAAGPASVVGRSVIVHRDPDDYRSQPAGNSGPRLACGVIAAR
jgi:Cu-Zn family superoxide dismutase